eukprot:jgi/Mesvir1/19764/Mv13063-RA.1
MGRKAPSKGGGQNSGMKPRKANRNRGRDDANMGLRPEDFEDEVDEFHKQRDMLSLDPEDARGSGESEEEDVYGIKEMDDTSDEDEDEDEEIARLKQQEKLMRKRLAMQKGGADDDDDEDEEEEEVKKKMAAWGRKKDAYYDADNVDYELTDDEEGLKEEEEATKEVRRGMVSKLTNEDYEQDDDDEEEEESEEDEEDEPAMGAVLSRRESEGKGDKKGDKKGGEKGDKKEAKKGKKESSDEEEDEDDEEETGKKGSKGKKGKEEGKKVKAAVRHKGDVQVETVRRELEQLTAEEKMAAVMSDAPELLALLGEMRSGLEEVKGVITPVLARVTSGGLATADGVSYLEAKHLLLLSYVTNIVFYLMLKAEGHSVRDHPVVARLVQIRAYLEKVRPIDKKLQYQIEKLLKAATGSLEGAGAGADAAGGEEGGGDPSALRHKPNPSALVSKLPSAEGEADALGDGIYRPPMMTPAAMEDDVDKDSRSRADKRAEREAKRRLGRSTLVKELAREVTGAPEEIREVWGAAGTRELREKKRLEARAAEEEEMFTRVNLSKEERKRLKALKRRSGLGSALDDFNDDVAGFVEAIEKEQGGSRGLPLGGAGDTLGLKKSRLIDNLAGTSLPVAAGRAAASGDMDVPLRADLNERRRQHQVRMERTLGGSGRKGGDEDEDDDDGMNPHFGGGSKRRRGRDGDDDDEGGDGDGGEDAEAAATYMAAKAAQLAKKRLKEEKYGRVEQEYAEEEEAEGKRGASYEMNKNRGLTPHRNKLVRNPRKKYKVKYEKAVIRRKSQVQGVRPAELTYGGEATGIKANISKSRRLG